MTAGDSMKISIQKTGLERFRTIVEIVAIVAAGCWAFYTFIHQEQIKPASEPSSSNVSVELTRTKVAGNVDYVSVAYTIRNTGKTDIDVLAQAINVYGENVDPKRQAEPDRVDSSAIRVDHGIPVATSTLVFADGFPRPADFVRLDALIRLPHGRYDQLDAHAEIFIDRSPVTRGKYDIAIARAPDGSVRFKASGLPSTTAASALAL